MSIYDIHGNPIVVDSGGESVADLLAKARHVKNNACTPLTLAHFSDIHADTVAYGRIVAEIKALSDVDDIICTGDLIFRSSEQISGWWDEDVMTCIGNHDSAVPSGYVLDWTGLSMANRDAYYIAPFESNWGITHESGKSYYYKDYSTQKVRLIVIDAMLYYGTPGAEATAQTAWLTDLLASARTNNLHVLIASHSPVNSATVVDCSFSQYGRTQMYDNTDCFTPSDVVDAVSSAITAGLHFIGYIVGHNHADYVFKPTNTQLGFAVTCAITSTENQWLPWNDMSRGVGADAYNLVTIDTANTLVKIVRGGGANMSDSMRARKAICFDYSTGNMVGEIK